MKGQLMAIGLSKQQVSSATADAIVNYLMNEDEKAKNAVAMYGAIIKMNERAGAKGADSVNNAGYVTYAYLGGQAKRDIRYDQSRDGENSRYADI